MEWLDLDNFSLLKDVEENYLVTCDLNSILCKTNSLEEATLSLLHDNIDNWYDIIFNGISRENHLYIHSGYIFESVNDRLYHEYIVPSLDTLIEDGYSIEDILHEYAIPESIFKKTLFEIQLDGKLQKIIDVIRSEHKYYFR